MSTPAVEITNLVKRFGATTAVAGLDLQLEQGSLLAVLGPNGAGKTTTIEICTGFLRPDLGTVRVLGLDPLRDGNSLRPRIGVMPQGGGAYPGVRTEEMLHLVAACAAHPLDPLWLLDILGLDAMRKTPFKRLSGGQRQRLSLACALIGRPELVFLDEPTAGMDPQARRLVWDLLHALKADGVTVVLTTHLMEEAEALADEVVIIDGGVVIAQGSPRVLTQESAETAQLRFKTREGLNLALLSASLPDGYFAEETTPGAYRVLGMANPQVVSTVTSWCAEQGALAEELHVGRRDLEDVFLELTGKQIRA